MKMCPLLGAGTLINLTRMAYSPFWFFGTDQMKDDSRKGSNTQNLAQQVSAFYERHPYPPPIDDLDRYRTLWTDQRRRADACLFWPTETYRDDRSILIAGCGTSQAAKYALRWPQAKVTGIDVSAHSIAHTKKLKQQYQLDNLEVRQLPIEQVSELGATFEHIVSTGVLHHLPDPDQGLRALREVLAANGAMQLMVYAPFGRSGVYLLQDYCRRLKIGTSSREIRELADSLKLLSPDHPLQPLLRNAPDFQDEAGLADALLHPQDRAYSVPQFFDFLSDADLQFGRWVRQAAYLPQCGVPASSPHQKLLAELPATEQYAALELFRGSMVRHSAIVYRNDRPNHRDIEFSGNAWLDYVPLRLPDTVAIQDRLPAGAAAVLINRNHTFTDLYLPINAQQKKLFDAIDGQHSIGHIAAQHSTLEMARLFFEGLWRYDQVVFEAPDRLTKITKDRLTNPT
jgi:SAM-dependent methyltransferase